MKKKKIKKIIEIIIAIVILIIIAAVSAYTYFFGNKKYIEPDITITSSSVLDSTDSDTNTNNKTLFIFLINGIRKEHFLEQYEILKININGEEIDLSTLEYRYLSKTKLSVRLYTEKYNEEGNSVEITIKKKENSKEVTLRLYNTTEVVI